MRSRTENELVEIVLSEYARKKIGVSSIALRIRLEELGLLVSDISSIHAFEGTFI